MPQISANNEQLGTLTTVFAADLSTLKRSVLREYPKILNQARQTARNFKIPVGSSVSAASMGLSRAAGERIGRSFASSVISGMRHEMRHGMLSAAPEFRFVRDRFFAGMRPRKTAGQYLGADYFREIFRDRHKLYLSAAKEQQRLSAARPIPLLGPGIDPATPDPETINNMRGRKAFDQRFGSSRSARNFQAFNRRFQRATGDIRVFTGQLEKASTSLMKVGAGISFASLSLGMFSKSSIMASSRFTEWQNVFRQSYKSVLPQASAAMHKFAKDFDLSMQTAQYTVGDVGELLTGIGFSERMALNMSMRLNRAVADIVSFRNIEGGGAFPSGIQRASHAGFMAMMGNSRSAKILGIAIRQTSPEFRKLEKSIMASTGVTLQQARALAVLHEIERQSRYATGDYTRTQYSFANSLRRVSERLIDMRAAFGSLMIRGLNLNWILTGIGYGIQYITKAIQGMPWGLRTILGLTTALAISIGPLIVGLGMIGFSISGILKGGAALIAIWPKISAFFGIFSAGFKAGGIAGAVGTIGRGIMVALPAVSLFVAKFTAIAFLFTQIFKIFESIGREISAWKLFNLKPDRQQYVRASSPLDWRPSRTMTTDAQKKILGIDRYSPLIGKLTSGSATLFTPGPMTMSKDGTLQKQKFTGSQRMSKNGVFSSLLLSWSEYLRGNFSTDTDMRKYIARQMASGKPVSISQLSKMATNTIPDRVARRMAKNAGLNTQELNKPVRISKPFAENEAANGLARYAQAALFGTAEGIKAINTNPIKETKSEKLLSQIEKNTRKNKSTSGSFGNGNVGVTDL